MTSTLFLHVGAPKSGTTYLQRVLETNRTALADAGVLVVGDTHLDRIHAAMVVREDPRLTALGPRPQAAWKRLVDQIRAWPGHTAILSYELFAGAEAEQVARALEDLAGIEVHVVVTARDFGRAVPSAWQERLKFALTTRLEDWKPRPDSAGPRAEWGWRTMDPAKVAARWGAALPADRVHVVTVPRAAASPTELWHRFAEACRLDVPGLRLDVDRVNESMGVVGAELLRRVNEHVTEPIDNDRERARWLRDTLAHQVLVGLDTEPIGLTDAQFDEAAQRSDESIVAIGQAGYAVHGDLEDVRATRPDARRPGEVTDAEVLDAALRSIVRLLLLLRERDRTPAAAGVAPAAEGSRPTLRRLGKRAARRATHGVLHHEVDKLEETVARLEEELQRGRALHLRVAELTDLVTELLLPGQPVSEADLARYRKESL